jgi:hypothetical protein
MVLLIVAPPLYKIQDSASILFDIIYIAVLFLGSLYTSKNVKDLILLLIIATITYLTHVLKSHSPELSLVNAIFTICFFIYVFINLIKFVFREKVIDSNGVYAATSGYLVLGIASAPLFYIIEQYYPGSFTIHEECVLYDFIYYSFITLTTVGFGDIVPVHPFAKAITLVISISGQLYLTILIAIIIGKYVFNLSNKITEI